MVMRNRHDGAESPGWWDDIPPKIRSRFTIRPPVEPEAPLPAEPLAANRMRDLGQLVLLFVAVAAGLIVFLMLAVSFLNGGPPPPFAIPGR